MIIRQAWEVLCMGRGCAVRLRLAWYTEGVCGVGEWGMRWISQLEVCFSFWYFATRCTKYALILHLISLVRALSFELSSSENVFLTRATSSTVCLHVDKSERSLTSPNIKQTKEPFFHAAIVLEVSYRPSLPSGLLL